MAFERCTREARGGRHVFFPRIPRMHDVMMRLLDRLSAASWGLNQQELGVGELARRGAAGAEIGPTPRATGVRLRY